MLMLWHDPSIHFRDYMTYFATLVALFLVCKQCTLPLIILGKISGKFAEGWITEFSPCSVIICWKCNWINDLLLILIFSVTAARLASILSGAVWGISSMLTLLSSSSLQARVVLYCQSGLRGLLYLCLQNSHCQSWWKIPAIYNLWFTAELNLQTLSLGSHWAVPDNGGKI